MDEEMIARINEILKRGNTVEIRRIKDGIAIVEVKRSVKIALPCEPSSDTEESR